MGVGEKLKDLYYMGEEKWYALWDKVDEHLPIYKIIDPIDNIIPSFALFLIVLFLFLLFVGFVLVGGITTTQSTLKLSVVDEDGKGISGASVTIEGITQEYTSNDFGAIDPINLPFNSTVNVTAQKDGKQTTDPITLDELEKLAEIKINLGNLHFSESKSIRFELSDGSLASGKLDLTYICSSGRIDSVNPKTDTIYGGTANVSLAEECGTLSVQVESPLYNTMTFPLTASSNKFTLQSKLPVELVNVTVNVKYQSLPVVESITVNAYRSGYPTSSDSKTVVNGQAQFTLPEGDYTFKVNSEKGYVAKTSSVVSLSKSTGAKSVTIDLEKNFIGYISATVKEGSTLLSGVHVTLNEKISSTTLSPVVNYDSNADGGVLFEIAKDAPYRIIATKDGYCDRAIDANVGANVTLSMIKENGQCGNLLKVRVIDQDGKAVPYAKVALFAENAEDSYKLSYVEKVTDYNGYATWNPVTNSKTGEFYKAFAFKAAYSGWSTKTVFNATTASTEIVVKLDLPLGKILLTVKDNDLLPLQFAEVQLFDEYMADTVSGKKMVENADGSIEFNVKADKKVYAVIKKEGYESYTTLPKQVIGDGTIRFEAVLSKPPVDQLVVRYLGLYKGETSVMSVEAGKEYDALFEVTAPKSYDELGFFIRVGKDNITKTELDKIFIKSVDASGKKLVTTGATYNKPRGYSTDEKYLNLEESKWAEIKWTEGGYVPGKILVGIKVKVRQTAQAEERLDIGYRAWGVLDGSYERDPIDSELGTGQNLGNTKLELYASTKEAYATVGTETLCEKVNDEKSFCITATYTDPENFTQSFTDGFEAKNNSAYNVSIKVMNNSLISFEKAKVLIENPEENLFIGNYSLITPMHAPISGTVNGFKTDWIDTPKFEKGTAIDFITLNVTPQKTGSATIKLRLREENSLIFEKSFILTVGSDKKMNVQYMKGGIFGSEMPQIVSGKADLLTVKAFNSSTNLEIENAIVKIYDRFGTKLLEQLTNKLGTATLQLPASLPGEKLTLRIEKPEYETFVKEFSISEDVIKVTPEALTFTVNPQSKPQDTKTVKIENNTGLDLTITSITLTGKLKGLLNEAQIESWFDTFVGKKIASQDFEEIDFKVISATIVPQAEDLDGTFTITVGSGTKTWAKDIDTKIRVGLGKDVDNAACLEITQSNWVATTQGAQIETSLEIKNNCIVDGKPVALTNLGATITTGESIFGEMNAQSSTVQVELGTGYARIFKTIINPAEKVPVTIKFTPYGGATGSATGTIVFEAINKTDSKAQKLTAEMRYDLSVENIQECVIIGSDLITLPSEGTASFTIQNTCKTSADFQVEGGELQLSNKIFTLAAGASKDVVVTRNKGDLPGAYNILVYGRKAGTTLELLGNVKAILASEGCFSLSRYEYDVFDSPYNEFDGVDRGYLTNNCVQKNTGAKVTGVIPYDMSNLWKYALAGAIGGYMGSGKLLPDWLDNKLDQMCTPSTSNTFLIGSLTNNQTCKTLGVLNSEIKTELKNRLADDCAAAQATVVSDRNSMRTDANNIVMFEYDQVIFEANALKAKITPELLNNISDAQKKTQCGNSKTCLEKVIADARTQKTDFNTGIEAEVKKLDQVILNIQTECGKAQTEIDKKFAEFNNKINQGQTLEVGKKELETYKAERQKVVEDFNKKIVEENNVKIKDANTNVYNLIEEQKDFFGPLDSIWEDFSDCEDQYKGNCLSKTTTQVNQENTAEESCYTYGDEDVDSYFDPVWYKYLDPSAGTCEALAKSDEFFGEGVAEDVSTPAKVSVGKCCKITLPSKAAAEPVVPVAPQGAIAPVADLKSPSGMPPNGNKEIQCGSGCCVGGEGIKCLNTAGVYKCVDRLIDGKYQWTGEVQSCKNSASAASDSGTTASVTGNVNTKLSAVKEGDKVTIGGLEYTVESVYIFSNGTADVRVRGADGGAFSLGRSGISPTEDKALSTYGVTKYVPKATAVGGAFLLTTTSASNSSMNNNSNGGLFGGMNSGLGGMLIAGGVGSFGGSALGGALIGMLTQWLQASNTTVDYSSTFTVPLVTIDETTLTSPDGISLDVGEKTYDYDSYVGSPATTATTATTSTTSSSTSSTGTNATSGYTGNSLLNNQALSATLGQVEQYELTFTNESKATNRSMHEPFVGILTVTGTENIYATDYNYDYVKAQATARGEFRSNKKSGFAGFFQAPNTATEQTAEIRAADLQVTSTRAYEKKFHLLFDSWEYVDCGPKTYTCPATTLSNCDVDGKKGMTGNIAVPKIKLTWDYSKIDVQECDIKETSPEDYIYCDTTQFGIETIKKLIKLREFFNSTSLNQCPQAIDYVSVKTATLDDKSLDVGITSVEAKQTTTGAVLSATVESNNNLTMPATVTFKVSLHGGAEITNVCAQQTKTLTVGTSVSGAVYTCAVDTNKVGQGTFDIDITATPQLCAGCGNYNSANDTMQTALVIGASGAVACQKYETKKDYFEKVLSANNQLSGNGAKILDYISFKANLIRDGFSNDFKNDFDAYLMQVANVGPEYSTNGIRELFLSEKFTVEWPNKPAAYEAGKYDARLIVTFANNTWQWDNNNIESIKLTLAPQGDPDPDYPIYDVPFDGIVGMGSDNGRQGYGSNYIQKTEDIFLIAKDGANNIMAEPDVSSNGIANVGVSVIKGNSAFALLNTSPTKGNVLSISRTGDDVDFVITPSVAVPLILNITRDTSTDAFAFYSAEVNGQPQEIGSSFISWNGIGEGCATFDGTPMKAFYNSLDSKANVNLTGYDGYGLYWPMAQLQGTASFYGSFFAPQGSDTLLRMTGSKDSATFESTMGNGNIVSVSKTGAAIENLQDVLDDVKAEKVCVIGGEYYWNNTGLREELISSINAKDNTCISAR